MAANGGAGPKRFIAMLALIREKAFTLDVVETFIEGYEETKHPKP
jgi:hypothetical protein